MTGRDRRLRSPARRPLRQKLGIPAMIWQSILSYVLRPLTRRVISLAEPRTTRRDRVAKTVRGELGEPRSAWNPVARASAAEGRVTPTRMGPPARGCPRRRSSAVSGIAGQHGLALGCPARLRSLGHRPVPARLHHRWHQDHHHGVRAHPGCGSLPGRRPQADRSRRHRGKAHDLVPARRCDTWLQGQGRRAGREGIPPRIMLDLVHPAQAPHDWSQAGRLVQGHGIRLLRAVRLEQRLRALESTLQRRDCQRGWLFVELRDQRLRVRAHLPERASARRRDYGHGGSSDLLHQRLS